MLFAGVYTQLPSRDIDEMSEGLALFTRWTPPEGFAFTTHAARVDGMGGVFFAEASPQAMLEATSVFSAYLDFQVWPVVDMAEAVPIIMRAQDWVGDRLAEIEDEYADDEDDA